MSREMHSESRVAGRPPRKRPARRLHVALDEDIVRELEERAHRDRRTMSETVNLALVAYFGRAA